MFNWLIITASKMPEGPQKVKIYLYEVKLNNHAPVAWSTGYFFAPAGEEQVPVLDAGVIAQRGRHRHRRQRARGRQA
jgi:hypothetical protein